MSENNKKDVEVQNKIKVMQFNAKKEKKYLKNQIKQNRQNYVKIIEKIERKIISKSIQNTEKASLNKGYTEFHECQLIAEEDLEDAHVLEEISNHTCFKSNKVIAKALDKIESNRLQKAIKLMKRELI